jgi:hypothetical protein
MRVTEVFTAKDWKNWLRILGHPQTERAPRRNPIGLAAMYDGASSPGLGHIKIISRTGLYLQTTERWPIGKVLSLTLQKENAAASDLELNIGVHARVASYGEDGVGMGFILPTGMDESLWEHLVDTADAPAETKDAQQIIRMVRAILFLYRLCPSRAMEPIHVLTGELDQFRTESMLTITLTAEKMLAADPHAEQMRANPNIVAGILKNGCWEYNDLTQWLWAGLLASSCSKDGADLSNHDLIEVLGQVTMNQAHILVEGCRLGNDGTLDKDGIGKRPVIITHEEMIRVTGMYDLYRNATDVAYLYIHGLMKNNYDFSSYGTKSVFDITPTPLAMRLFKECRGHLLESSNVLS